MRGGVCPRIKGHIDVSTDVHRSVAWSSAGLHGRNKPSISRPVNALLEENTASHRWRSSTRRVVKIPILARRKKREPRVFLDL